jgi:hypothetical protein
VNPQAIDFGSLDIGASATASVTITNDDSSPTTLTRRSRRRSQRRRVQRRRAERDVLPAASPSVVVGFIPTGAGGKSATLSNAGGSVRTVSLLGSSACPAITIGSS